MQLNESIESLTQSSKLIVSLSEKIEDDTYLVRLNIGSKSDWKAVLLKEALINSLRSNIAELTRVSAEMSELVEYASVKLFIDATNVETSRISPTSSTLLPEF